MVPVTKQIHTYGLGAKYSTMATISILLILVVYYNDADAVMVSSRHKSLHYSVLYKVQDISSLPGSILVAVRTLTIMRISNGHIQRGGENFFVVFLFGDYWFLCSVWRLLFLFGDYWLLWSVWRLLDMWCSCLVNQLHHWAVGGDADRETGRVKRKE